MTQIIFFGLISWWIIARYRPKVFKAPIYIDRGKGYIHSRPFSYGKHEGIVR